MAKGTRSPRDFAVSQARGRQFCGGKQRRQQTQRGSTATGQVELRERTASRQQDSRGRAVTFNARRRVSLGGEALLREPAGARATPPEARPARRCARCGRSAQPGVQRDALRRQARRWVLVQASATKLRPCSRMSEGQRQRRRPGAARCQAHRTREMRCSCSERQGAPSLSLPAPPAAPEPPSARAAHHRASRAKHRAAVTRARCCVLPANHQQPPASRQRSPLRSRSPQSALIAAAHAIRL